MNLVAIGINFKTAPLELRERISYSGDEAKKALLALKSRFADNEFFLLSTCNRTELYVAGRSGLDAEELARSFLSNGRALDAGVHKHLYFKESEEAMEHLLTVAASLDSLVVGETEILGQVKQAYEMAREAGTAGKILNVLLQQVFRVSKRVRTETALSLGRVSVGSIAVDLAARVFDDLASKVVMIVGAGKVGEQTIKTLVAKGVKESYVVNRSLTRGRAIADRYGSIALPFDQLPEFLARAAIVVSSTSAPHCVIRADMVRDAMRLRRARPMLLIDLAVPRDIDDSVGDIDDVYLYNIDDLQGISSDNLASRRDAMEHARQIIREEAAAVAARAQAQAVGIAELMRKLDSTVAEIKEAEVTRVFAKESVAPLGEACDRCRDEICNMLHRALSKMAAGPKKALHQAARDGRWDELAQFAAEMYGIEEPSDSEQSQDR